MIPNWKVGGKEYLYGLEIVSDIDLVTWKYDLAKETFSEACPLQAPLLKVLTVQFCKNVRL